MATPPTFNYRVIRHPKVNSQDLPELPEKLKEALSGYERILGIDPHKCLMVIPSHNLERGYLDGCRAIEIEYENIAYRLVYQIFDSKSAKRVEIISIAIHDPAYDRATDRVMKSQKYYRRRKD